MKKIFISAISICLISIFILNCKINIQENDYLDRPEIMNTSNGVGITISRYSKDTDYINLYRRDLTTSSESSAEIVNIGLIFPEQYNKNDKTYFIEDLLVYQGHKYQYRLRYSDSDGYIYTEWTDTITVSSSAYNDSVKLSYSGNSVNFTYNSNTAILQIIGTLNDPAITNYTADWKPALVVSCGGKTIAFELTSVANATQINLRQNLPKEFCDKDIKIEGIVGQKIIYDNSATPKEKNIFWTGVTVLSIQGYSARKLKIPTLNGSSGYDHS